MTKLQHLRNRFYSLSMKHQILITEQAFHGYSEETQAEIDEVTEELNSLSRQITMWQTFDNDHIKSITIDLAVTGIDRNINLDSQL